MSTRLYPLYQQGNPQLRVFLPNFWMKLIRPQVMNLRPNTLHFLVSMGMSRYDVKNYLEKIYNVPVVYARTYIHGGKTRRIPGKGYIVKDDDCKVAFVTLPKHIKFEYPEIFPAEKVDKELESEKKNLNEMEKNYMDYLKRNKLRPDVPGWFL